MVSPLQFGIDLGVNHGFITGKMMTSFTHLDNNFHQIGGFHAGIYGSYYIHNRLSFGIELNYTNINERLEVTELYNSVKSINNPEAFLVNGDFLAAKQTVNVDRNVDILQYNHHHSINLRPTISYLISPKTGIGVKAFCTLPVWQSYKGFLLTEQRQITTNNQWLQQREISFFNPGGGVFYQPSLNNLGFSQLYLSYQNNRIKSSDKRHLFSLGVRFRL